MKRYKLTFVILFMLLASVTVNAQNDKQYFTHKVKKGETLYSLSKMYDTTVDAIVKVNPGSNKVLSIGQILKIPQTTIVPGGAKGDHPTNRDLFHTIKPQETLYRLSKEYGIDYIEICNANPGLKPQNFKAGEVIVIPLSKKAKKSAAKVEEAKKQEIRIVSRHRIKKDETIESICEEYGILKEDFIKANPQLRSTVLKKKDIVNIPKKRKADEIYKIAWERELSDIEVFGKFREHKDSVRLMSYLSDDKETKVAVILPFMLNRYSPNEQARMVEFYEGLLMAVYRLKNEGYSFEINTFDSGYRTQSIDSLINSRSLDRMDLIIGAYYPEHNTRLAEFAKEMEIPLVIPFSNKQDEIFNNPMVYTVNTMQSYIIPEVAENILKMFPDANVIFVEDTLDNNKAEFVKGLTSELEKHVIPHTSISMDDLTRRHTDGNFMESLQELKKGGYKNIIIPTSSSATTLYSLAPVLAQASQVDSTLMADFILFGYPEWQKHASNTREQLYLIDTYFYTSLYSHYSLPDASLFHEEFIRWYNRPLNDILPRYGMLGYDIGYYFLYAINEYGKEMPNMINEVDFAPIQSGFKFERVSNWGGMINKKIFFIHYDKDYSIKKIDLDKCQEEIVVEERF